MKWLIQILSLVILLSLIFTMPSLATTVINEDFRDIGDWTDLSTAITWGNYSKAKSAFTTEGGTAHLTAEAFDYTSYNSADTLKTFTALERKFPAPINHAKNIVTSDFRAKWSVVENLGAIEEGRYIEGGRFMIILNYDYPKGGLNTTLNRNFNKFDQRRTLISVFSKV